MKINNVVNIVFPVFFKANDKITIKEKKVILTLVLFTYVTCICFILNYY